MNFMNKLYEKPEEKKFRLTRGMLILGIGILVAIIIIVIVIISALGKKEEKYTMADFSKLEKRMEEEAPIYLDQKNIELTSKEIRVDLKDMLLTNGGTIDANKTTAVKVCDGYVIAKKEEGETYSAYIKCGNLYTTSGYLSNDVKQTSKKTTTLKDTTKPDITLIGESEITINLGTTYKDFGARATDNVDGDITSKIKVTGSVDTSKEGSYTLTYSITDKAGNKNTKNRKVIVVKAPSTTVVTTTTKKVVTTRPTVKTTRKTTTKRTTIKAPTTPPTITLYGNKVVTVYVGNSYNDPGYSARDSLGNNITSRVNVSGNVNTKVVGTYYVNYKVTDGYGNSASVTRTVTVKSGDILLSGITLSPNAVTLKKGSKTKLTVYFSPSNATNKSVSWSSDKTSVAKVDSSGNVTAVSKGVAIITVRGSNGKSASARITVQ